MFRCARPDCLTAAKSTCSDCGIERYCSIDCQKVDRKIHKSMCPILKKLTKNKLQSSDEAIRIIKEILALKINGELRVLEHLLLYAENQLGTGGTERGNNQRIEDWDVDISVLYDINRRMHDLCINNHSLGIVIRIDNTFPYLERMLGLLSPWLVYLDSDSSNPTHSINNDLIDFLLQELLFVERGLSLVAKGRNQFDVAEGHCLRCLAYSRRFRVEGENKITAIFGALTDYRDLRLRQGDYPGELTIAKEAYNLLVDAYDPVHPQVQEAAGILISSLIDGGNLDDAERFAEQTYENIRDKKNGLDQEGEEVATGSYNLADIIHQRKGDLIKAEELARESLRIRGQLHASDNGIVAVSTILLAKILQSQSKLGDETKYLFERSLAIFVKQEGPDGPDTACGNISLGDFYLKLAEKEPTTQTKKIQLLQAKLYLDEAVRIQTKIHSPNHPNNGAAAFILANVLRELSQC